MQENIITKKMGGKILANMIKDEYIYIMRGGRGCFPIGSSKAVSRDIQHHIQALFHWYLVVS